MKVGLIGHRGRETTIFNMLTGLQAQTGGFGGKEEIPPGRHQGSRCADRQAVGDLQTEENHLR